MCGCGGSLSKEKILSRFNRSSKKNSKSNIGKGADKENVTPRDSSSKQRTRVEIKRLLSLKKQRKSQTNEVKIQDPSPHGLSALNSNPFKQTVDCTESNLT